MIWTVLHTLPATPFMVYALTLFVVIIATWVGLIGYIIGEDDL